MLAETIKNINARIILNSRAEKTIEVDIITSHWQCATSSVPSGKSTGSFEAKSSDPEIAIENINHIKSKLIGMDIFDQAGFDKFLIELDGSPDKSVLGANTILALSECLTKVASISLKIPTYHYIRSRLLKNPDHFFQLPIPCFNVINGGLHADSGLPFQEFMLIPKIKSTFKENFFAIANIYHKLKNILAENNYSTGLGDEGGFAPKINDYWQVFDLLKKSIEDSGFSLGKDIFLGIDASADNIQNMDNNELIQIYSKMIAQYNVIYLEDGCKETDEENWKILMDKFSSRCLIIGDDLIATNINRLKNAINKKLVNAIIIKPNQIGTISEVIEVCNLAHENNIKIIVSHRSGETNDNFIADFAIAIQAHGFKSGAPARGERLAKYNRILKIEENLKNTSEYNILRL
ncbi:MAG: Enolase [Candidatus Berkelbacteria bacterium Licking1014_85]|uniref:Enolase n=1 Tax=Candidatus Berkelbacteria bacterium Licking1014_85 TaxID=2017148 RepID=A0A554LKQ1_9BACT|nr:MAG: Enolase [Candidatus Berkelbacteria bacterium Licking1014_85]